MSQRNLQLQIVPLNDRTKRLARMNGYFVDDYMNTHNLTKEGGRQPRSATPHLVKRVNVPAHGDDGEITTWIAMIF